jgi:hypothetical protein
MQDNPSSWLMNFLFIMGPENSLHCAQVCYCTLSSLMPFVTFHCMLGLHGNRLLAYTQPPS